MKKTLKSFMLFMKFSYIKVKIIFFKNLWKSFCIGLKTVAKKSLKNENLRQKKPSKKKGSLPNRIIL